MKLVIGASGFVGSHVTRQLVEGGNDVRVMLRKTSSTKAIDDLPVQRHYGDVFDDDALRAAMTGCDVVYHCVVDTRAWLRDPAPLFRTNVEGLRHVLDAAVNANLSRFVFTSTIGTMALGDGTGPVNEDTPFDWHDAGPYVESRVAAENLVLQYARDNGLPAVALCISNTYGPGDWGPTPHGRLLAAVASGRLPFYPNFSAECVGIEDAARAMILAADRGRVGERYIISDRYMSMREVHRVAAEAVGARRPIGLPMKLLLPAARAGDVAARVLRRDLMLSSVSFRMADKMPPLDHSKAVRELGWAPEPVTESIRKAARWFNSRARTDADRSPDGDTSRRLPGSPRRRESSGR
jgi:dihydroflavonol-4-reductase